MRIPAICSSLVLLLAGSAVHGQRFDPAKLLPAGEVVADVMALAPSPRLQELTRRFREAVSKDSEWWRGFVAKAPAGQPPPYDPRMGLTEAEYREIQDPANRPRLAKSREVRLTFRPIGERAFEISAPGLPDLDKVTIHFKEDYAETPFGRLSPSKTTYNDDASSPTGRWSGVQWSLDTGSPDRKSGTVAKLALGQLESDGRTILYFTAQEAKDGNLVRRADATVYFTAKRGPS